MRRIGPSLLLLAVLASPSGAQVAPTPPFPINQRYEIVSLNGQKFAFDATLTIMRGATDNVLRGSGYAGCNSWTASVALGSNNQFRVVDIGTTGFECPRLAQEKKLLAALKRVTRWRMEGRTLILEGGSNHLRLDPHPFDNWI